MDNKESLTNIASPGASITEILRNVMMYTITTINGKKVGDMIGSPQKLNKFSADQAYIILQQINKDFKEKAKQTSPSNNNVSNGSSN